MTSSKVRYREKGRLMMMRGEDHGRNKVLGGKEIRTGLSGRVNL